MLTALTRVYTILALLNIMIFLSYYYEYIEFEKSDSYYYFLYTYININGMRFSVNPPWYISIFINPTVYMSYRKGMYTVGNYTMNLNVLSYILINVLIMWIKLPLYIINKVYTYLSRRFLNRPEYIYVAPSQITIRDYVAHSFPQRIISNNNNFHGEKPDDCILCLEKLNESDSKTSCGHYFHHRTCLMKWLMKSGTTKCPTCKSELELSNEELAEIMNYRFYEPVETYNNNIFDNILHYIDRYTPRFNDGDLRLRFFDV